MKISKLTICERKKGQALLIGHKEHRVQRNDKEDLNQRTVIVKIIVECFMNLSVILVQVRALLYNIQMCETPC
jgi:hypothetical protein